MGEGKNQIPEEKELALNNLKHLERFKMQLNRLYSFFDRSFSQTIRKCFKKKGWTIRNALPSVSIPCRRCRENMSLENELK